MCVCVYVVRLYVCAVNSIERRLAHKTQVACFDDDHQARLIAGNQMFLYRKLLCRGGGRVDGGDKRSQRGEEGEW